MMASAALFALTIASVLVLAVQTQTAQMPFRTSASFSLGAWLRPTITVIEPEHGVDEGLSATALMARWQPFISEASRRFSIPEAWIRAVIRVESGGRTTLAGKPITSSAGAAGVMQLMEDTYAEMRDRYDLGTNVQNPHDNIMAGAAYLKQLHSRYGYPNMFAAYNAGPGRLKEHLTKRKTLPQETRNYIGLVVGLIDKAVGHKTVAKNTRAKPSRLARS